jgi:hypothetical protein
VVFTSLSVNEVQDQLQQLPVAIEGLCGTDVWRPLGDGREARRSLVTHAHQQRRVRFLTPTAASSRMPPSR